MNPNLYLHLALGCIGVLILTVILFCRQQVRDFIRLCRMAKAERKRWASIHDYELDEIHDHENNI